MLWYGLLWWFGLCVNSVVHFIYIYVACHFILICVLFCVVDGGFGFDCVSLLGLIVVNACLVGCKLGLRLVACGVVMSVLLVWFGFCDCGGLGVC